MKREDYLEYRKRFRSKVDEISSPQNCIFCGGIHEVSILRNGTTLSFRAGSCNEFMRKANEINNELLAEYN